MPDSLVVPGLVRTPLVSRASTLGGKPPATPGKETMPGKGRTATTEVAPGPLSLNAALFALAQVVEPHTNSACSRRR